MKTGKVQLCKGRALVKIFDITPNNEVITGRANKITSNAGTLKTEIIEGKGFRIISDSKRDNGSVEWSVS